jgi:hypothetical protein
VHPYLLKYRALRELEEQRETAAADIRSKIAALKE